MDYRQEIDGLRALAVLPVILFHAGFQTFGGGFVGVDVFFVISGYLITTIIISDLEADKFSIVKFYERRARRILPALFLVMLACLPFAWFWLLPQDLDSFSQSLVAVSAFVSNVLFWRTSGYFDTATELKPLLHTWSLAVEEQYYVLFPVFLMLAWRLGKRWILSLLAVAFLVSLAVAQWGSMAKPAATFYLLPTRGWELLVGAFVAFHLAGARNGISTGSLIEIGGVLGIALVLYAVFFFDKQTPFPSLYTLVPTIGTALIILCARRSTLTGRLLGGKLLVGVGLISYSAYLWHQPLLAFVRHRSFEEPSKLLLGSLAVGSLFLAYFSWKYVEVPFRDKRKFTRNQVFSMGLLASLTFVALGLMGHFTKGLPQRFEAQIENYSEWKKQFARHALRDECDKDDDGKGWSIAFCVLGDTSAAGPARIAVFGDSHANALNPLFDHLGKKNGVSYVHIGLGGCPPLLDVDVTRGNFELGVCESLSRRQFEFVKSNDIKTVILVSSWSLYTDGKDGKTMDGYFLTSGKSRETNKAASRKEFELGLARTLEAYGKLGVQVYIVLQVPRQKVVPETFYTRLVQYGYTDREEAGVKVRELSVDRKSHALLQAFNRPVIENLARMGDVKVLNPDSVFCDDTVCPIGNADVSHYRDADHVSENGAMKMEALFADVFERSGSGK